MIAPQEARLIYTEDEHSEEEEEEEDECLETLDIAERNYEEVFDERAKANNTIFRTGTQMAPALSKCKIRRHRKNTSSRRSAKM